MAKKIFLLDIIGLILLCFLIDAVTASPPPLSKPNCTDHCGNITIPFPFGRDRSECFLDEWYEIDCRNGTIPYLKKLNLQVLTNISTGGYRRMRFDNGYGTYRYYPYVTVNFPIIYTNDSVCSAKVTSLPRDLKGSPFAFSDRENVFTAVGSSATAMMSSGDYSVVGCKLHYVSGVNLSTCNTTIPSYVQTFDVDFNNNNSEDATRTVNGTQCNNYAFLANESWLQHANLDLLKRGGHTPVALDWGISNDTDLGKKLYDQYYRTDAPYTIFTSGTYDNRTFFGYGCGSGYEGNPYLTDGCHDINECEDSNNRCPRECVNTRGWYDCVDPHKTVKRVMIGIGSGLGALLLAFLGWWLYRIIKKRKEKKLREKYFKRNGGLKLQEQLLSSEGTGRLFNKREIEIATENFSESRILGKGGQGTVYKGMLTDGKIVAIKKALVIDEEKVEQFINEVLILTQISHRNIVQLLGCCLETEIPLLVYEFIPNGNLYEYLHGSNKDDPVSWEVRLQLAIEIAGALFYMHSAASIPVYHRDIKSTNILLGEKYQAKIADFGTSRLASLDETHVTTLVQGTIGYLDPEYFQTNQFTDKSDVYSFGVVLVELLTRQKPISTMRIEEAINLATYFTLSVEDGHLFDILDAKVLDQAIKEEVFNVANLAQRCLLFYGRNRPTMREVVIELERIKKLRHVPNVEEVGKHHDQVQCPNISKSTLGSIELNTNVAASFATSLDVQPLLHGST